MKFFIIKTEEWKEIDTAIAEAVEYLQEFDIKIDSAYVNIDITNPQYYHTSKDWHGLKIVETKSLHGGIIRALGQAYAGQDYDYYGMMVDKRKSLETNSLWGQHSPSHKTIEVYVRRRKTKEYGLSADGHVLVHEILHAMASHYKFPDTLHQYVDKNKDSLDGYIDYVRNQIKPKVAEAQKTESEWKYKYFKPTERTGNFGTVADLRHELLIMLDMARDLAGVPFVITSGFRSEAQNRAVGGASNSAHLRGYAVDIRCTNSGIRQKIVDSCIRVGFNRIGIAKTFIHVDCDPSLPSNKIWLY